MGECIWNATPVATPVRVVSARSCVVSIRPATVQHRSFISRGLLKITIFPKFRFCVLLLLQEVIERNVISVSVSVCKAVSIYKV